MHLTFYDGTYSEVDLEDKVDIIDEYAFAYMKGIPRKCISEKRCRSRTETFSGKYKHGPAFGTS